MSALAGPSRLGQSSIRPRPLVANAGSLWDREESDLSDLVARLSIEDIDELENCRKGKGKEGAPLSDAEVAFRIFAEDARALMQYNNDRALAQALSETEELPLEVHTTGRNQINAVGSAG